MSEPYDPSPEEIAAACERIRETWTAAERERRSAWAVDRERVEVRTVSVESDADG